MPAGSFEREKVKGLVFNKRTAKSCSWLHACVGRIAHRRKRISRLYVSIAKICVCRSVHIVRAALGNDIDHTTRSLPVLGVVAVGNDLEFLHRFLRNSRANTVN